jgi:DMSO/TMAO reductase YedYZ heme-binding membrane subunit
MSWPTSSIWTTQQGFGSMWKDWILTIPFIKDGYAFMEPRYTKILRSIHMFSIQHKQQIISFLFCIEVLLVLLILGGIILSPFSDAIFPLLFEIGLKFGTLAAGFLTLALIPGILGRFRWFIMVRIIMMLFRRHFGILMYLSAVVHSTFVVFLPMIRYGFYPLQLFEVYGLIASLLLLPLYLTSNDVAVQKLKQWWYRIHRLVYIALFFAAMHTWTTSKTVSVLLFVIVFLEAWSFIEKYRYDHSTPR